MNKPVVAEWIMSQMETVYVHFREKELPDYMWEGVRLYVAHGICPGHFLTSALQNSLSGAFSHADDNNIQTMRQWVMFFYNDLPSGCWGSTDKVEGWLSAGGLVGIDNAAGNDG